MRNRDMKLRGSKKLVRFLRSRLAVQRYGIYVPGKRSLRALLCRLMPMGGARLVCKHCEYPLTAIDISLERERANDMGLPVPDGQHDRLCAKCQDDADETAFDRAMLGDADDYLMGPAEQAARRMT